MGIDDRQLDKMLSDWEYKPAHDPDIHKKVRERIHNKYFSGVQSARGESSFTRWLVTLCSQPMYACILILAVVVGTVGIATLSTVNTRVMDREMPLVYRQMINPANTAKAQIEKSNNFQAISQHYQVSRETLGKALDWIERKVDLNATQTRQFEKIHEQYYDEFESLYISLLKLENEYRMYERQRVAGEDVDLLSVYGNLNAQKEIYRSALQIQQRFIDQIFQVLDAEQKGKYGELFLTPANELIPSAFFSAPPSEWKI